MSPNTTPNPKPTRSATGEPAPGHRQSGGLSEHDPPTDAARTNRPPLLLIIAIVLLATAVVVLHLTGVIGPGSH